MLGMGTTAPQVGLGAQGQAPGGHGKGSASPSGALTPKTRGPVSPSVSLQAGSSVCPMCCCRATGKCPAGDVPNPIQGTWGPRLSLMEGCGGVLSTPGPAPSRGAVEAAPHTRFSGVRDALSCCLGNSSSSGPPCGSGSAPPPASPRRRRGEGSSRPLALAGPEAGLPPPAGHPLPTRSPRPDDASRAPHQPLTRAHGERRGPPAWPQPPAHPASRSGNPASAAKPARPRCHALRAHRRTRGPAR